MWIRQIISLKSEISARITSFELCSASFPIWGLLDFLLPVLIIFFEGIRLHFSSTPIAHNILASAMVIEKNNATVSNYEMIHWRASFFKRTQTEKVHTLLLYRVSFYFCKQSLKFISLKLLCLFPSYLHECSFFVSFTHKSLFSHHFLNCIWLYINQLQFWQIIIVTGSSISYATAENIEVGLIFSSVKIISNIMVWSLNAQTARLLEIIKEY